MDITEILDNPTDFLNEIFRNLALVNIDISLLKLDHICYRVATKKAYSEKKNKLLQIGQLLASGMINGREISTFKLNQPIGYKNRKIFILELPSPKLNSPYPQGFEHVEFVTDCSLEKFQEIYSFVDFDQKAMTKKFNRDLRISFGNISVKFHEQSLESVIQTEQN